MRVLIVEDSPQRQALLSLLFAEQDIVTAINGRDAVLALQGGPFDAVLLDHDLGDELTGADVAATIAKLKPPPEVIVHSMNPQGVAAILRILPDARTLPFDSLHPRGEVYSHLKQLLLGGNRDWDRFFARWMHRRDR